MGPSQAMFGEYVGILECTFMCRRRRPPPPPSLTMPSLHFIPKILYRR